MGAPRCAMLIASVLLVIFALANTASATCSFSSIVNGVPINWNCDGSIIIDANIECDGKLTCFAPTDKTCTGAPVPCDGTMVSPSMMSPSMMSPPPTSGGGIYKCKFHKSANVTGVKTKGTFEMEMADDEMYKAIVEVEDIKGMINAHIHLGAENVNGPPVVFPFPQGTGAAFSKSFRFVFNFNASLLDMNILNNGGYYFNVHTKKYPAGEGTRKLIYERSTSSQKLGNKDNCQVSTEGGSPLQWYQTLQMLVLGNCVLKGGQVSFQQDTNQDETRTRASLYREPHELASGTLSEPD